MTRVLLLDTAFAARPVHDWLLEQGLEVWTIGNRPDDVLARRDSTRYLQLSYADVAAVQAQIDRLEIQHVVPGCTDVSIETAQQLKVVGTLFDTPETYRKLADKAEFRALCATLDLPAPRRISENLFPLPGRFIAKPSNAFSGRGISVFDGADSDAALQALDSARAESRNGEALIETFVEGDLYSYSCFLEEQTVVEATIVREDGSVTPYAVDTSHVVSDFAAAGIIVLQDSIERLARHLALVDGLLHVQFIWDNNTPWLIELSRRCPGDLYPRLVELSTGMNHAARYASYFVSRRVPLTPRGARRYILRHTLSACHENYEGLWFNETMPVVEFHPLAALGRERPVQAKVDRVALMFLEYSNEETLKTEHERFLTRTAFSSKY